MFLRGSNTTTFSDPRGVTWDGFYVGGHVGMATTGTDFANSTASLIAFMLRNTTIENENHVSGWTTLGKANTSGASYGGFVGYQTQWDSAVIGVEAGYSFTNLHTSSSDSMGRMFGTSDGYTNNVNVTATSATAHHRLRHDPREGRLVTGPNGSVLPYGFVGLAIGRGDIERSVRVVSAAARTPPARLMRSTRRRHENRNGDLRLRLYLRLRCGLGGDAERLPARRVRVHPVRRIRRSQDAHPDRADRRRPQVLIRISAIRMPSGPARDPHAALMHLIK